MIDDNKKSTTKNNQGTNQKSFPNEQDHVGHKLKEIRNGKGYSLRSLAQLSGLNINTLSLIENGKTSPSVSTLQQLAIALNIPITAFFEAKPESRRIVFTKGSETPFITYGTARLQYLGKHLTGNRVQPFFVNLEPGSVRKEIPTVHTGYEFAYCLAGEISYLIDNTEYTLHPGDSLVFESQLPHYWTNVSDYEAKMLLIFFPSDHGINPGDQHFSTLVNEE